MVVFDSTFLTFLFVPNAKCSVDRARDRIENLIGEISGRGDRIIIPTPALSELLVRVGHSKKLILNELTRSQKFLIAPFELRAALEVALMGEEAIKRGDKKGGSTDSWAKVKYDRQIVAIAKVCEASIIYSEDPGLCRLATALKLTAKSVADLSLPTPRHEGPSLFS